MNTKDNRKDYEPLLKAAEREQSASGKCRWIVSILRMMTMNDLHHLYMGQCAMRRQNNKLFLLVTLVLAIVLVTNPQVGTILRQLIRLIVGASG